MTVPVLLGLTDDAALDLDLDALADYLGMAASGGTFGTYLSRLAGPDLIERDRDRGVRLNPEMMG